MSSFYFRLTVHSTGELDS